VLSFEFNTQMELIKEVQRSGRKRPMK